MVSSYGGGRLVDCDRLVGARNWAAAPFVECVRAQYVAECAEFADELRRAIEEVCDV